MSLTNVARRLTAGERARESKHLHVVAWFDGWGQAQGMRRMDYRRRLTAAEARSWREGWRQAVEDGAGRDTAYAGPGGPVTAEIQHA